MNLTPCTYKGWKNCLSLGNGDAELIITLDVGPRIISYALKDGPNVFKNYTEMMGVTCGEEWMIFGGHRLWHAPEDPVRTYATDFQPVAHHWENGVLTLSPPSEAGTGLRKEISLTLAESGSTVRVLHRLYNESPWEITLAPWALSVMDTGARAIVPQEPFVPHGENLLPARPLVQWKFTDLSDPRWKFSPRYLQLQQDPQRAHPQKIGMFNSLGWAACAVHDQLFIVKYPAIPAAVYADMGCNTEFFTNGDMLEVETLGPLAPIPPGGSVSHEEIWSLFNEKVGSTDADIDAVLLPCLEKIHAP